MSHANCHSCGMPIESGKYCQHCVDEKGHLQGFDETVARMAQFWRSQDATLTPEDARAKTLAHMATMPAWKDHPRVRANG